MGGYAPAGRYRPGISAAIVSAALQVILTGSFPGALSKVVTAMLKVKNRSVIRRLALREMRSNRKLNIVVIVSIMLTCILFTALTSIGGSLINGMQQETMRQVGGDRMAGLKCVLPEDYEKVREDGVVRDVVYRIVVGWAENDKLKNVSAEIDCAGDETAHLQRENFPKKLTR